MRSKVLRLYNNETYYLEEVNDYYESYYNNSKFLEKYLTENLVTGEDDEDDNETQEVSKKFIPRKSIEFKGVIRLLPRNADLVKPVHSITSDLMSKTKALIKQLDSTNTMKKFQVSHDVELLPASKSLLNNSNNSELSKNNVDVENAQLISSIKKDESRAGIITKKHTPRFNFNK